MRAWLIVLMIASLLGAPRRVDALQMPTYEGEAVLAAGQDETSDQALRAALQQVLVKVSGDRSLATDPTLGAALAQARSMLLSVATRPSAAGDGSQRLVANFDPGRVHDLLASLGRPIWHSDRPALLVWLAIDDGSHKQIANANQVAALSAMTQRAHERGIPLLLPRMDGIDQNRINPVTLWAAPPQTVIAASQRYGVQTVLVIRLTRGTPWRARQTLIDGRAYEEWEQSDAKSNVLLAAAIDGAADRLARRYAVEPEGAAIGAVEWWVDGIASASDYARVVGYLGGLEFVRSAQPLRAEANQLLLRLDLGVSERRLRQLLAIDQRLEFVEAAADAEDASAHLRLVR
jgi:hypothetical protein